MSPDYFAIHDPITELIAKSIVNVTASGERNPEEVVGLPHRSASQLRFLILTICPA
jgi:hypothetical protein